MALRERNSGTKSARKLLKGSEDATRLLDCTQKKLFAWGLQIFVSDIISGGLSGHLGPLYLPWAQTIRW